MKKQECLHADFYTMGNDRAYCNNCHEYLGFFSPYKKPYGFHKKTKDTISEKYLNEKNCKHGRVLK